jgi:phosphohistidine phosphatase
MERTFYIIRHGKSSWESIVNDIDRPLTERGVKNAYEMAQRLQNAKMIPEVMYTSNANRAFHTAAIMASEWEILDVNFNIRNKLYLPEIEDISEVIFEIPDSFASAAIVGHNPAFLDFSNRFFEEPLENLPTAGIVILKMTLDSWKNFFEATIHEVLVDCPKNKQSPFKS